MEGNIKRVDDYSFLVYSLNLLCAHLGERLFKNNPVVPIFHSNEISLVSLTISAIMNYM